MSKLVKKHPSEILAKAREGIIVLLYWRFVVYPGGAGVNEGAGVEEVSLVYASSSTPAPV